MTPTPLVSILIPCHNAATWLAATLDSALAQTWPHCEIIVVDDGSTDNSPVIARGYEPRGVIVITQPNCGASAARNAALGAAHGEFVQFLDADDLLAADKIALQMSALSSEPSGTIASGPWGVFVSDPAEAVFHPEPVWSDHAPVDWLVRSWSGGGMFPPIVWLTPRAVVNAAGPWNETLSLDDDGEYFARVLLQAARVHFVAEARSYYRVHNGPRVSAARGNRAARSSFASCALKEQHLLAVENSKRTRGALACNWQRFAWEQLTDVPSLADEAIIKALSLNPALPPPEGPRAYRIAAHLLGWQRARRLHLAVNKLLRH